MFDYKFKNIFFILFIVFTSSWKTSCHGQNKLSIELEIYFPTSSHAQQPNFMDNQEALSRLDELLTPNEKHIVESIHINGYSSLEGSIAFNQKISLERANTVKSYIQARFPAIVPETISTSGEGENWGKLRELVENDMNTPNRSKILYIIDNVPAAINYKTNTSRKKSIMELGVVSWEYMHKNMFPYLRSAISIVLMVKSIPEKHVEVEEIEKTVTEVVTENPAKEVVSSTDPVVPIIEIIETKELAIQDKPVYKTIREPLFAIKTNLLFDAISALNFEIEIPIGMRWSVAAEYIFPWWLWESKQYTLQTLSGNIEGRYWLGNREKYPQLTGWFAGIYAGAGYFDIEWGDQGYQGEYFIVPGISCGYAHTIGKKKNLRMEYSFGVGYMQNRYSEYYPKYGEDSQWHLMRRQSGTYYWIIPTRLKVSLAWMLNKKKKGGSK